MQHTHTYSYWHTHRHSHAGAYGDPHGHAHVYTNTHNHSVRGRRRETGGRDVSTSVATGDMLDERSPVIRRPELPHTHDITYYHPDDRDSVEHHAAAGVTCRLS